MSDPVLVKPWPRKVCGQLCTWRNKVCSVCPEACLGTGKDWKVTDRPNVTCGPRFIDPMSLSVQGCWEVSTDRPLDFINFSHFVVPVVWSRARSEVTGIPPFVHRHCLSCLLIRRTSAEGTIFVLFPGWHFSGVSCFKIRLQVQWDYFFGMHGYVSEAACESLWGIAAGVHISFQVRW